MPAGYSGTPLLKKLGISDQMSILLIDAPKDYFVWVEKNLSKQLIKKNEIPDFVHVFASSKKELLNSMQSLKDFCKKNSRIIIWVSWYKKSAGIPTDVTEDIIREYALKNDLVDIKVCAVSEEWSGLKLVVPKAKR
jgi:hypothetical protein